jgi:ankyrin repeat protein
VTGNSYTFFHTELTHFADRGNAGRVEELLKIGANPNEVSPNGVTPLVAALSSYRSNSRFRIIRALLEAGADPNTCDRDGNSALMPAVMHSGIAIVRTILKAGADPRHVNTAGETAMDFAFFGTPLDSRVITALLQAGADPNRPLEHGDTPLTDTVNWGDSDSMAALLDHGADPDQPDDTDDTPLNTVMEQAHYHRLLKLLLEAGADPERLNKYGRSPLVMAVGDRWTEGASLLFDHGASPDQSDHRGRTLRQLAYRYGYWDVVELLGGRRPPPPPPLAQLRRAIGMFVNFFE